MRTDRSIVPLLAAGAALSPFVMTIAVPSLPSIGRGFDADLVTTQAIISAYLLGLGLAQPFQGPLCDRFGRRRMLLLSFTVLVLASWGASASRSLGMLVAARLGQALGASAATVVSRAMIRDRLDGDRAATAVAWVMAAMGISPMVAPPLGGALDEAYGWRLSFVVSGVLALTVLAWAAVRLPETLDPSHRQPLELRRIVGNWSTLLRSRRFLGYTGAFGFANAAFFVFLATAPDLFERKFGIGAGRFGIYWSVLSAGYLIGALITARSSARFGRDRLLLASSCLALVAGITLVLLTRHEDATVFAILGPISVVTFSIGFINPLSLAGAVDPFPEYAGTASGLASALAMAIGASATVVAGRLYDGSALVLTVGVCVATFGTVASAWLARPSAAQTRS